MIQPANAEDLIKRNALIMSLSQHLSPGFSVVPPTVRFPFPAVAHPEMGLCAVFVHESPLILEEGERRWYGAESVDPERAIAEATMELSAAAKAPLDRVTGIAWLPQGYSRLEMPGICTSPAPEDAAAVIEDALSRVPNRTDAPLNPWYANYIVGASGPKGPPSEPVRRVSALVEKVLEGIFADKEAVIAGTVLGPTEFADPRFLLPALLACASEDWDTVRSSTGRVKGIFPGFKLQLTPDPGSLLGYRVDGVIAATPYLIHGPVAAVIRRFDFDGEFALDDLVGQFARYLEKNGLDATVLEEYEYRLATAE